MSAAKITPNQASQAGTPGLGKYSKAGPIADRLGISTKTLYRWADQGRVHRHKVNARVVLFEELEIQRLIDSAKVATA